jgi:hypothetical protein
VAVSDPELKNCPFCGDTPAKPELYQDQYGYWVVGHGPCGTHSGTLPANSDHFPNARERIIASWNRRASAWRPISEVPEEIKKDSTRIIVCVTDSDGEHTPVVGEALWHWDTIEQKDGAWYWAGTYPGGYNDPIVDMNFGAPTQWMPLPEPPETPK